MSLTFLPPALVASDMWSRLLHSVSTERINSAHGVVFFFFA